MTASALAVQKAFKTALDASTAVHALIGDRIYDRVPETAQSPYAVFADWDVTDEGADCDYETSAVTQTIRIFSRDVGTGEAKAITGAIRNALHNASFSNVDGFVIGDC